MRLNHSTLIKEITDLEEEYDTLKNDFYTLQQLNNPQTFHSTDKKTFKELSTLQNKLIKTIIAWTSNTDSIDQKFIEATNKLNQYNLHQTNDYLFNASKIINEISRLLSKVSTSITSTKTAFQNANLIQSFALLLTLSVAWYSSLKSTK